MPIKKYQKELDAFYKKQKWPYWSPLSMLAALTEEVGEFARLVNHKFGDKPKKTGEAEQNFESELGDIIFSLICFANDQGLDLDRAIKRSMHKVATRDKHRWDKKKK